MNENEAGGYELSLKETPVMEAALRIIDFGPQFSGIIRIKLIKKGFSESEVQQVIQKLKDMELLDDVSLSRVYAGELLRVRYYGPAVVGAKLYEKGVCREDADAAVRQALEENGGELELCRLCLNKKIDSELPEIKKMSRLAIRGFSSRAIRFALKQQFSEYSEN